MFQIIPYDNTYRDDMIFCLLLAKDAVSRPKINEDLLDVETNYLAKGDMFWLALNGENRVIGLLGARTTSYEDVWLKRFYVKPGFKRTGIGRGLLAAAQAYCQSKGCKYLHTRFSDNYEEAALFYPAMGFQEAEPHGGLRHMVKVVGYN